MRYDRTKFNWSAVAVPAIVLVVIALLRGGDVYDVIGSLVIGVIVGFIVSLGFWLWYNKWHSNVCD